MMVSFEGGGKSHPLFFFSSSSLVSSPRRPPFPLPSVPQGRELDRRGEGREGGRFGSPRGPWGKRQCLAAKSKRANASRYRAGEALRTARESLDLRGCRVQGD